MEILAFVPTEHTTAKAVLLWKGGEEEDAICRSIVAAVFATKEFVHEIANSSVMTKKNIPDIQFFQTNCSSRSHQVLSFIT